MRKEQKLYEKLYGNYMLNIKHELPLMYHELSLIKIIW